MLKLSQREKNIALYVVSIMLILMAVALYLLKGSSVDLNETVSDSIEQLKFSEKLRAKYTSQETYLVALEEQLLTSFNRENEKLSEDIDFYENMFSLLLMVGGIQFIVLVLPLRNAE